MNDPFILDKQIAQFCDDLCIVAAIAARWQGKEPPEAIAEIHRVTRARAVETLTMILRPWDDHPSVPPNKRKK